MDPRDFEALGRWTNGLLETEPQPAAGTPFANYILVNAQWPLNGQAGTPHLGLDQLGGQGDSR